MYVQYSSMRACPRWIDPDALPDPRVPEGSWKLEAMEVVEGSL
jgi:hypothetical protein